MKPKYNQNTADTGCRKAAALWNQALNCSVVSHVNFSKSTLLMKIEGEHLCYAEHKDLNPASVHTSWLHESIWCVCRPLISGIVMKWLFQQERRKPCSPSVTPVKYSQNCWWLVFLQVHMHPAKVNRLMWCCDSVYWRSWMSLLRQNVSRCPL